MNGLDIFSHSLRQVFGNFAVAVKISALLYLVQFGVTLWLGSMMPNFQMGAMDPNAMGDVPWGLVIVSYLVLLITGLWIAVAWHRYILLSEEPNSFVPTFRGDRMLAYFGYSILIALIMIPIAFILTFVVGLLAAPFLMSSSGPGYFSVIVVGLLVYVPMIVIVYRLSVVLPAAALEESLGIGGAWERTKGTTGAIIVLAIVSALGFIVIGLPVLFIFNPGSVPAIIWSFFTDWVAIMVGVSILTTLYGHYVEERPLV